MSKNVGPVRSGVVEALPIFAPAIPFGFVLGIAITTAAMPTSIGFASSFVIWAGSAQLAVLTLAGSASWLTVVATGIVINSRHIMYSAALAPRFRDQPRWFRFLGPYFLIDQMFALASANERTGRDFRLHYLGMAMVFAIGWHVALVAGFALGSSVPESWQIAVAPPVMFTGFVVFALVRRPAIVASIVATGTTLLALGLPHRLGILVGAAAGVLAGYIVDARTDDERDDGVES